MNFHLFSYEKHEKELHQGELTDTWKRFDTVDYWRHERMYNNILPLIDAYPASSWLTVGDGRYGTDANFLIRHGADALATDINDNLLMKAHREGFITKYKRENAEQLSFDDNHFDFVLCKESYHHFPRPILALYEMLRVCKKGVLLIEPHDHQIINPYRSSFSSARHWFFHAVKNQLKSLLGRARYLPEPYYEPIGNFVYSISQRELEKIALGMNFPALAFKTFNDVYLEGVENELVSKQGPLLKSIVKILSKSDALSKQQEDTAGLLIAIIFKNEPSTVSKSNLEQSGFRFQTLSRNPYAPTAI